MPQIKHEPTRSQGEMDSNDKDQDIDLSKESIKSQEFRDRIKENRREYAEYEKQVEEHREKISTIEGEQEKLGLDNDPATEARREELEREKQEEERKEREAEEGRERSGAEREENQRALEQSKDSDSDRER